jgi:hypothetical protein
MKLTRPVVSRCIKCDVAVETLICLRCDYRPEGWPRDCKPTHIKDTQPNPATGRMWLSSRARRWLLRLHRQGVTQWKRPSGRLQDAVCSSCLEEVVSLIKQHHKGRDDWSIACGVPATTRAMSA